MILGYVFLFRGSRGAQAGLTRAELAQEVEAWLFANFRIHVTFDVGDALDKLHELGVLSVQLADGSAATYTGELPADARFRVASLDATMRELHSTLRHQVDTELAQPLPP